MGANVSSCSPPSNLLLWLTIALKLVVLAMPHSLLFSLSNLRSSSWFFVPLEFLIVLLFMVILSWFKHEVFNQCSSWYYIPLKALIVIFSWSFILVIYPKVIGVHCDLLSKYSSLCSSWISILTLKLEVIALTLHGILFLFSSLRSLPWSSIMLLYSLDIFFVVFYVPTFFILGIQGVHCHNFSFGFITRIGAWQGSRPK